MKNDDLICMFWHLLNKRHCLLLLFAFTLGHYIHVFYSFKRYLWCTYFVPCTVLGIFTYLISFHLMSKFHHHHFIGKNTVDRGVWGFCQVHITSQGCSQTWHPGPSLINKYPWLVGIKHPTRHWENWNYWDMLPLSKRSHSVWGWGGER